MKKKMIWVAGILIATSAYAQTDVSTGIMRGKDYGVTYLLPKTEIEIVVQATKHTYMPGEFCKYADRYLRMNNVSADPNIYWTIDKVQTHVAGVPDKDNVYFFMDKKLDEQTGEAEEKDDPFKISDLGTILSSGGFWLVALLCVLYYSAIFPFQKYAVNMLQCNLVFKEVPTDSFWATNTVTILQYCIMLVVAGASFASNFMKKASMKYGLLTLAGVLLTVFCYMGYMRQSAETVFAVFPLLAVGITPILGNYVDHKGKAASMLMIGSMLLVLCHLTFAFVLPEFRDNAVGGVVIAYLTILVLGASFSLVPASLWPSVPKLVDAKIIGSAYALIFWVQNIGLWLFPLLIGKVLDKTNTQLVADLKNGVITPEEAAVSYDYTAPLVMLACLGVAALVLGFILKVVDKKKGLGLEEPNIKA